MTTFDQIRERLEKHGQVHLLQYWDEITDDQRRQLKSDIEELNLAELTTFFDRATASLNECGGGENIGGGGGGADTKLDDRMRPIPDSQFLSTSRASVEEKREYEHEGLRQVAAGHVGVLLMAGGQGTRLGSTQPKGMFNVGLCSQKSLFRLQAERILSLQRFAYEYTGTEGRIAWYIMTSEHTMAPTRAYFEANSYFGMRKKDVFFFEQGSLPCYGFDGKILMDQRWAIAKAPDGNGGIYRALRDRGVLADMQSRGLLYLHAYSVDNILIKPADPVFIGYCVVQAADCAAKVVEKTQPDEAVGVICMVEGSYQVVEYSEISTKTSEMRDAFGRLTFNAGNICNHFFTRDFLERIAHTYERELKLHVAKKKIPFIDNTGGRMTPDRPNGIKIEKFVFDVFPFAQKFVALEVQRSEEFSPLKNADAVGKECASTARADTYRLHRRYIEAAGGRVTDGDECEISPLLSYAGEGLEHIVGDKTFKCPVYLKSSLDPLNGHL